MLTREGIILKHLMEEKTTIAFGISPLFISMSTHTRLFYHKRTIRSLILYLVRKSHVTAARLGIRVPTQEWRRRRREWAHALHVRTWWNIIYIFPKPPHRSSQFYSCNVDTHFPFRTTWGYNEIYSITGNDIFRRRSGWRRRRRPCVSSLL